MTNKKKGWKVIVRINKNKESATRPLTEGGVRYYFSKWTKPKKGCGPLCVFDNYEDALRFSLIPKDVYECLYVPSKIKKIWTKSEEETNILSGTVLAESVKLLKKKG